MLMCIFLHTGFVNAGNPTDYKLVLVGIVLDTNSSDIQEDVVVKLEDNLSKEVQVYVTEEDGQFLFNLKEGRIYTVTLVKRNGEKVDKHISTINKVEPEILYAIIEN